MDVQAASLHYAQCSEPPHIKGGGGDVGGGASSRAAVKISISSVMRVNERGSLSSPLQQTTTARAHAAGPCIVLATRVRARLSVCVFTCS